MLGNQVFFLLRFSILPAAKPNIRIALAKRACVADGGFDLRWRKRHNLGIVITPTRWATSYIVMPCIDNSVIAATAQLINPVWP